MSEPLPFLPGLRWGPLVLEATTPAQAARALGKPVRTHTEDKVTEHTFAPRDGTVPRLTFREGTLARLELEGGTAVRTRGGVAPGALAAAVTGEFGEAVERRALDDRTWLIVWDEGLAFGLDEEDDDNETVLIVALFPAQSARQLATLGEVGRGVGPLVLGETTAEEALALYGSEGAQVEFIDDVISEIIWTGAWILHALALPSHLDFYDGRLKGIELPAEAHALSVGGLHPGAPEADVARLFPAAVLDPATAKSRLRVYRDGPGLRVCVSARERTVYSITLRH